MSADLTAAYAEVLDSHRRGESFRTPDLRAGMWVWACHCECDWLGPDRDHQAHVAAALVDSPATKAHEADVFDQGLSAGVRGYHPNPYRAAATEGTTP